MTDEKPPRLAGDERATLTALLTYQRGSLLKKLDGIDDRQASASPVPSGTSLLWLANHMADAESTWVLQRFAGRAGATHGDQHAATIDRAVHRYRVVCAEVDAIVASSSLDELCHATDGQQPVDLRWILGHLLEETARHAGHADIIRELIDGSVGR
ncbi:MAG: DinB family protein [Actinomycetota bacterium]|nr:DinB family protein [Actinomycetota bacterium]